MMKKPTISLYFGFNLGSIVEFDYKHNIAL